MENLFGKALNDLGNALNADLNKTTVLKFIKRYSNHLSFVKIKNFFFDIDFPEGRTEDLTAVIKPLNPNKATKDIIITYLRSFINKDLKRSKYS